MRRLKLDSLKTAVFPNLICFGAVAGAALPQKPCAFFHEKEAQLWTTSKEDVAAGELPPCYSPGGRRIAYVRIFHLDWEPVSSILVRDEIGQQINEIGISGKTGINAILQFGWLDEQTLWAEGHVNPTLNIYYVWDIYSGRILDEKWGTRFKPSPDGKRLAYFTHVLPGAPPERASPCLIIDGKHVYPKGNVEPGRVSSPLVWSYDGVEIAWAETKGGVDELLVLDVLSGDITQRHPLKEICPILQLDWPLGIRSVLYLSHNGNYGEVNLACSP